MGKTTASEASFIKSVLEGLTRRPVKHRFDVEDDPTEGHSLPAASRPFSLRVNGEEVSEVFSVTVKALKGNTTPTAIEGLNAFDSVDLLKNKAAIALDVPVAQLRLVYKGKALSAGSKTLQDYSITAGAIVHVMVSAAVAAPATPAPVTPSTDDIVASVGASKEFWADVNAVIAKHLKDVKKDVNTKVLNSFVHAYADLVVDGPKSAAVKKNAKK
ncbi:hypothetical protein HDU81_010470 [Chytriomyces hyalinus]|nr:hypothetical protein HDU81_010470 [Chytriomyces hyalinus]